MRHGGPAGAERDRLAEAYEAHRGHLVAVLRRRCGWLGGADREALVHEAYLVLLDKDRGGVLDVGAMAPHEVRAYLAQTALNKALDEGRRAGRRRSVPLPDEAAVADDRAAHAEELVDAGPDHARVREIVAALPPRQQTIVKLRFFFERSPGEIQTYLGITERAYRRDFERAMRTVADGFELLREGRFCESRRSLVLAFVAGIAGPGRTADARRHLATCRGCAAWAAQLRAAGEQVAAAAPLPLVADAGRLQSLADRVAAFAEAVKQQIAGVAVRAEAVVPAAGARPGAAAAAIAGCLALGGGATYCAVEGLPVPPPIVERDPAPERRAERRDDRPRARADRTGRRTPAPVAAPPRRTPPAAAVAPVQRPRPTAAERRAARRRKALARVVRRQRRNAELTFEGGGIREPTPPAASAATSGGTPPSTGTAPPAKPSAAGSGSGTWSSELGP